MQRLWILRIWYWMLQKCPHCLTNVPWWKASSPRRGIDPVTVALRRICSGIYREDHQRYVWPVKHNNILKIFPSLKSRNWGFATVYLQPRPTASLYFFYRNWLWEESEKGREMWGVTEAGAELEIQVMEVVEVIFLPVQSLSPVE